MKTRSYRNNNPGNLRYGPFCIKRGATGQDDKGFAIFPTASMGFEALFDLLRTKTYGRLTLKEAMHRYAPQHENDTGGYLRYIIGQTGVLEDQVLGSLPPGKIVRIMAAITLFEGWDPD